MLQKRCQDVRAEADMKVHSQRQCQMKQCFQCKNATRPRCRCIACCCLSGIAVSRSNYILSPHTYNTYIYCIFLPMQMLWQSARRMCVALIDNFFLLSPSQDTMHGNFPLPLTCQLKRRPVDKVKKQGHYMVRSAAWQTDWWRIFRPEASCLPAALICLHSYGRRT